MKNMLSREEITHIAGLARVRLTEEEIEKYQHDLSGVLDFVRELEAVEIPADLEMGGMITGKENGWREDRVQLCSTDERDAIVRLFPDKDGDSLKVKSVF